MNEEEAGGLSVWVAIIVSVLILAILWIPELGGASGLASCIERSPCDKNLATVQGIVCGFLLILNGAQAWLFNFA
jgi:hypothetical protein